MNGHSQPVIDWFKRLLGKPYCPYCEDGTVDCNCDLNHRIPCPACKKVEKFVTEEDDGTSDIQT